MIGYLYLWFIHGQVLYKLRVLFISKQLKEVLPFDEMWNNLIHLYLCAEMFCTFGSLYQVCDNMNKPWLHAYKYTNIRKICSKYLVFLKM